MSWDPGPRPAWVQAVNGGQIEPISDEASRPFTVDAVLDEALALDANDGGMAAFGNEAFHEPLEILLAALDQEAELTVLGRWITRRFLLRLLVGRLQLERYVADDPGAVEEEIREPLVVAGLPRSGTTILHALLMQDQGVRAPLGWELLRPVPPPLTIGQEDGRVALAEAELRMLARVAPTMDAIHEYGARNAKECVSTFSFEMRSEEFTTRYAVPSYAAWLDRCDMRPSYERHKLVLQILQRRTGAKRWVLKSPMHLHSLPTLTAVFPDARLAITHRDPVVVMASMASLVANLRWVHSDHVDLHEIGAYFVDRFQRSLVELVRRDEAGALPTGLVTHSHYADFLDRPIDTVRGLYGQLGMALTPDTERRMVAHLADRPQCLHGQHHYDFADLRLDRQQVAAGFADYVDHFAIPVGD